MKKVALIMAGGVGIRLWPRSTEKSPKQFMHFIGDGTMIQNTVFRLKPIFDDEDIFIITSENMLSLIEKQLPSIPKENIILEPFAKHTAPCIALGLTAIRDRYDDDTIVIAFPSDHIVENVREFQNSIDTAISVAHQRNAIVTIGIMPTRPETDFGYVQINNDKGDLAEFYDKGVRYSKTFAEKPDLETAKRFINAGDFLWNSGIFIWRIDTFWNAFEKFLPEHDRLFKTIRKIPVKDISKDDIEYIYRQMQAVSVDYAILEKADNVYVVESSFRWSDVGTWDELYRLSMKDGRNNIIEGNVISINTNNCFVSSTSKLLGIVGVEDIIVIESDDAILICKRGASHDVKELVDYMRRKQINMFI